MLGTIPPANQTSAITNEITIVVGSGPESRPVPDVTGQTVESAQQILTAYGFTKSVPVDVDSPEAAGQVVGTNPPAGQTVPLDTVIQMQVSRGNQFIMPDLRGQFWTDAEPRLRALGWTGVLDKGADVQNSGQRTNAVVTQSPSPGTRGELRRHDHAELRGVAARTVSATSSSSVRTSDSAGAAPQ